MYFFSLIEKSFFTNEKQKHNYTRSIRNLYFFVDLKYYARSPSPIPHVPTRKALLSQNLLVHKVLEDNTYLFSRTAISSTSSHQSTTRRKVTNTNKVYSIDRLSTALD